MDFLDLDGEDLDTDSGWSPFGATGVLDLETCFAERRA